MTPTQTPKRSIFEIDAELTQIADAFDQLEENGTEEDIKASVMAYFGDLIDERDEKLDRYASFIAMKNAAAKFREEEAARLAAMAKSDKNAVSRLKGYLKMLFEQNKWSKIETPSHKFWTQSNGGQVPIIVDEIDMAKVDPCYKKVTVTLDMEAIRADLEAKVPIAFARFGEVGTHLRVK